MKKTIGLILLLLSTIVTIVSEALYHTSVFSAEYGPLIWVEVLLIGLAVAGVITLILSIKGKSEWINLCEIPMCFVSMLSLTLSFYTMMTPVGYVVSGLNPFTQLQTWVFATTGIGIAFILHVIALFFPVISGKRENK